MDKLNPLFDIAKQFLSPEQKKLVDDVITIISALNEDQINDYSFIVSPMAKAYEGYLKDFFLKAGIIDNYTYQSDRFRVGKTLNPSLRYKRFSIYQKLIDLDQKGEELAEDLWTAWKYGRNEIFHYFPKNVKILTRDEAGERIDMILNAIIKSGQFLQANKKYLLL